MSHAAIREPHTGATWCACDGAAPRSTTVRESDAARMRTRTEHGRCICRTVTTPWPISRSVTA